MTVVNEIPAPALSVVAYGAAGNGTTDDTAAIQSVLNLAGAGASRIGAPAWVDVVLPSGFEFLIGQLVIPNGVRLWCHGAAIIPNLNNPSFVNGLLTVNNPSSQIGVVGGSWLGTGNESGAPGSNQFLFFPGFANVSGVDLLLQAMYINNWGVGPLYCRNVTRARMLDNTIENVGNVGNQNYNTIGFSSSGAPTNPLQTIIARGNIIEGSWAAAIAWTGSLTGTAAIKMVVSDNITTGSATSTSIVSGAINIEQDASSGGPYSQFDVHDNIVNNNGTNASAHGIHVGVGAGTIGEVTVHHNTVHSTNTGILVAADAVDTSVTYNRITAPTPTSLAAGVYAEGNRFTSGPVAGRATLVAGTVTVATAEVQTNDNIQVTRVGTGASTALGVLGAPAASITGGTSFVINSYVPAGSVVETNDVSAVFWKIMH